MPANGMNVSISKSVLRGYKMDIWIVWFRSSQFKLTEKSSELKLTMMAHKTIMKIEFLIDSNIYIRNFCLSLR